MRRLGWLDLAAYALYAVMLIAAIVFGPRGTLWISSVVASLACAVLWTIARLQLGTSFSVGAEAHSLVTSGLYAKIRHPIYVFGTLAYLTALLALQGPSALPTWVVVGLVQLVRARREDAVLAETFGEEYETYRGTTWF